MSFEEKYNRYRNSQKLDVSEDYVNKTVNKLSEEISNRKGIKIPIAWSVSGVSFASVILVLGLFVYPRLQKDDSTLANIPTDTTTILKNEMASAIEETLPVKDSGMFVAVPTHEKKTDQQSQKTGINDLDQETILEYLLDEGYDEI